MIRNLLKKPWVVSLWGETSNSHYHPSCNSIWHILKIPSNTVLLVVYEDLKVYLKTSSFFTMWHHRGSATHELCLQIILKKYRGDLWLQQENILQFSELGNHGKLDFAHLWCQVWFIAHQIGLPCILSTPHQAMKYLDNQGGWNVMRGLVMQKLHTVYTHGAWFKCHFEKENQISNLHSRVPGWFSWVYMHKNAFPAWNSVRPRSTFSESWVNWRLWSISVSLWDEMGTSADQMKQDWMKLLLLDEFDTSHKFLQRKVTKPSKLFGRNNGYSFDTSEWIFPMMASNQTRCSKYLWHWKLRWVKCRW